MDRESLEALLRRGLSLAEIGRRFGRSPSTVGYWVRKHGLVAAHHDRHSARGGLSRECLEVLISDGHSVRQIAEIVGFSPTSVRHWMRRYGIRTQAGVRRQAGRRAKRSALLTARMHCRRHGVTAFAIEGRGAYRCTKCRSERVARARRVVKAQLVADAGGACRLCGYDRYHGALGFHHLDPSQKSFAVAQAGASRSLARLREEAAKCVLLCANCHAEVEAGLAAVVV